MSPLLTTFAATCSGGNLFNIFPTWYEFIGQTNSSGKCVAVIHSLSDVWLIVAAIIEILLRLAALAAVAFIIYGGVLYATSQASPDQTKQAKDTIINALIGLIISLAASVLVAFIAEQF